MLSIDIQNTKEVNLERVQQNITEYNRISEILIDYSGEAKKVILLDLPQLPTTFIDQFISGSYYYGINIYYKNANDSVSCSTNLEDVNNEHNSVYLYLKMGKEY